MEEVVEDNLQYKSLRIDYPSWQPEIQVDDFLVSIGKTKSNSIYHVAGTTKITRRGRIVRQHMKVVKSDLVTMVRRDNEQKVIPFTWNR